MRKLGNKIEFNGAVSVEEVVEFIEKNDWGDVFYICEPINMHQMVRQYEPISACCNAPIEGTICIECGHHADTVEDLISEIAEIEYRREKQV